MTVNATLPKNVPSFFRGDTLNIRVRVAVDGVAEPQAGNTLQVVLRAKGATTAPKLMKSQTVTASPEADDGRAVIRITPAESAEPPAGAYELLLIRVTPAGDRWTFHRQDITVLQGAVA